MLTLVVAFLKEFRGQAFIVADFGGCAVCGCVLVLSFVYSFCEEIWIDGDGTRNHGLMMMMMIL